MFDNGSLMPAYTDDVFRYLASDGPPDYADGDVEAPTGWFALGKWTREEFSHAVAITGSPRASEAGVLVPDAWYAVKINSDGILWAFEYNEPNVADWDEGGPMWDFDRAVDEYNEWLGVENEIAQHGSATRLEDDPLDYRGSAITPRNLPI